MLKSVGATQSSQLEDDQAAVARMSRGDSSGLDELYRRHGTSVYSLALRVVGNPADAEDVSQEVFAQVWRAAQQYDRTRGAVAAWLLVIARTRALDRVRRRRTSPAPSLDESVLDNIPSPGPSVELIAATGQQAMLARAALEHLSVDQRTAVELAYFEGLTHREIAERTSTPLGTIKTRIRTALQQLREAMSVRGVSMTSER